MEHSWPPGLPGRARSPNQSRSIGSRSKRIIRYVSTRGGVPPCGFEAALFAGLAADSGLYLPECWPRLERDEIVELVYREAKKSGMDPWKVRVACETLATTNRVIIAGEVRVPDSLLKKDKHGNIVKEALALLWVEQVIEPRVHDRAELCLEERRL